MVIKMNTMYKRISIIVTGIMILGLVITGCTSQASNIGLARENDQNTVGTDFVVAEVGSYDSADTAVVVSIDSDAGYITFMNIATGKQYTLSYDGTTYVKDRYELPMAMSQVQTGDIVDITFLKSKKRLASVQLSPNSWVYNNIENYDLGGVNKTATIGSNTYSLPDEAVILSEGRRAEVMEIVDKDVLTVSGIDHTIYSINVDKGHGYLRLSNDQALVGGWIEVGNAVVQRITDNMLLAVPEGSYQVVLTNDNASCIKEVVIERNKEVVLDVSDLEILQDKTGKILISVNPSTATVKIDGEIVDISDEIELTYGIHQIRLEAEGYDTMTKYIQVGSEYASINFTMEEGETSEENSVSDNSSADDITNAVTGNRVYVDAPKSVEVYLDGNYVGVSPISFTKVTGDHTITLSKSGYISKSYTVYLYDDGEDITYSFADLESEYDNTVSSANRVTSRRSSRNSTSSTSNTSTSSSSTQTPQNPPVNPSSPTVSGNELEKNTVYVYVPDDAKVYLDNGPYGTGTTKFGKIFDGEKHTITVKRNGYKDVVEENIRFLNDGYNMTFDYREKNYSWIVDNGEDNKGNLNPDDPIVTEPEEPTEPVDPTEPDEPIIPDPTVSGNSLDGSPMNTHNATKITE